ncbi:unnamed protein product [Brassica rapa]|uniref:BnaA05g17770D protein n=2 Tax=Brassica TaxID=3705 RepID=A0A078GEX6_BRANA|nr:unnamed protein product [Brassica rapa]CDY23652.1 BnaA05g17770D [Brassica napus]VDC71340.1 unnamed protein product [Brassica rapa]
MLSKRKSSTKSRCDRSVPNGSSSQHVRVVPKVEFSADSIDPEEIDAYWTAKGEVKPPIAVLWAPPPFKTNPMAGYPSRSCPNGLAAIRRFCRIPESVEFRIPEVSASFYPVPEGLLTVRELLHGRPCFWAYFSPKRVCCAVALYRSQFQPDLPIEEGSESSMDGFIPYVPQTKRDRSKPRNDKHLMVDEDVVDGQLSPDNILKDYLNTEGGSKEVPDFSKAARMVNGGCYNALANYRECHRTVGGLYLTQLPDYSFTNEYAKQTENMAKKDEKDKDLKISEVEEEIWEQWESVPVSPDTVEAKTGDPGEVGVVDKLVAPLNVNDYSIGRSISGDFDLGD